MHKEPAPEVFRIDAKRPGTLNHRYVHDHSFCVAEVWPLLIVKWHTDIALCSCVSKSYLPPRSPQHGKISVWRVYLLWFKGHWASALESNTTPTTRYRPERTKRTKGTQKSKRPIWRRSRPGLSQRSTWAKSSQSSGWTKARNKIWSGKNPQGAETSSSEYLLFKFSWIGSLTW